MTKKIDGTVYVARTLTDALIVETTRMRDDLAYFRKMGLESTLYADKVRTQTEALQTNLDALTHNLRALQTILSEAER